MKSFLIFIWSIGNIIFKTKLIVCFWNAFVFEYFTKVSLSFLHALAITMLIGLVMPEGGLTSDIKAVSGETEDEKTRRQLISCAAHTIFFLIALVVFIFLKGAVNDVS